MMHKTVGEFHISTSPAHPVWCSIRTDTGEIKFRHEDIRDLEHCVQEIKRHAILELKKSNSQNEV